MAKSKEDIPQWVTDEIRAAEFGSPQAARRTGYILEIYEPDRKADVQLYEPVEDGRHIVTVDLPPEIGGDSLEKGAVYEFTLDSYRAPLSKKTSGFLQKERGIEMDAVFRFVLKGLEPVR